jgi:hypothetical protein
MATFLVSTKESANAHGRADKIPPTSQSYCLDERDSKVALAGSRLAKGKVSGKIRTAVENFNGKD